MPDTIVTPARSTYVTRAPPTGRTWSVERDIDWKAIDARTRSRSPTSSPSSATPRSSSRSIP